MVSPRRIVASSFSALVLTGVAFAVQVRPAPLIQMNPLPPETRRDAAHDHEELILHAYTLRYQSAGDAQPLINSLLSPRGTVELQPGGNTLVIRDTSTALNRILPVLRSYDHAVQPVRVEILLVKASRVVVSPPVGHSDLPESLTRRLRQMLSFENFETQAQAQLSSQEGQVVTYDMGEDFEVNFRIGTVLDERRVKLYDFQVLRRINHKALGLLLHTHLNLYLDQTLSLGLARSEASREALLVVLTVHRGDTIRARPEP
ncbi:MAG: hypothetical protein M3O15_06100 [Acidobacteriota bacterium]|nr:hypothetical protein [Acidobacteriota bacterium]